MVINYKNYIWLAIIVVVIELLRFGAVSVLGFVDGWTFWRKLAFVIVLAFMQYLPMAVALYFYQRSMRKQADIAEEQRRNKMTGTR